MCTYKADQLLSMVSRKCKINLFFTQVCSSVTSLYLPHISFHSCSECTYLIRNGSLILPEAASLQVIRCFAPQLTKYACIRVGLRRVTGSCYLHRNPLLRSYRNCAVFFVCGGANTLIRYRQKEGLCAHAEPSLMPYALKSFTIFTAVHSAMLSSAVVHRG